MAPATRAEWAAVDQARRFGHHWVGWQHVLLALLAGDPEDPARRAMEASGLALDPLESRFLSSHPISEPAVAAGVRPNAHFYRLLGRAEGFALGTGARNTRPVDLLISMLWDDTIGILDIVEELGVARTVIRDALDALDIDLPSAPLPEQPGGLIFSRRVDLSLDDAEAVVQLLAVRHPPGSGVWAFNRDEERAWIVADDHVDLQGIVEDALAPPTDGLA